MECVFCKIANKQIESEIIYEDENFIAFLDIVPRSRGMTLLIPKKHLKSFSEDEELSKELFILATKIAEIVKNSLGAIAVSIAYLPSQIEHLHLRIYPYYENEIPLIENKPKESSKEELKKVGDIIRKNMIIERGEKAKVEIVEERKENVEKKNLEEGENNIFTRRKRDWLIA